MQPVSNIGVPRQAPSYQDRFLNITDRLGRLDHVPEGVEMVKYEDVFDESAWKRKFQMAFQSLDPAMGEANKEIDAQTDQLIQSYFSGKVSDQELKDSFLALAKKSFGTAASNGFAPGLMDGRIDKLMLETFYSEFRRKLLAEAVTQNNEEGKQYIQGELGPGMNWDYYNSDYYYKSESAIAAITDGIQELASERGHKEFEIPNYAEKGLWLYNNFNSCMSNPFLADEHEFLDLSQKPPEGFVWFYQTGAGSLTQDGVVAELNEIIDKNGVIIGKREEKPKKFDPNDFNTATMWATLKGKDGKTERITAELFYNRTEEDLYNVGDLMQFSSSNSAQRKEANAFLKNLQAYREGYFVQYKDAGHPRHSFNCRV